MSGLPQVWPELGEQTYKLWGGGWGKNGQSWGGVELCVTPEGNR